MTALPPLSRSVSGWSLRGRRQLQLSRKIGGGHDIADGEHEGPPFEGVVSTCDKVGFFQRGPSGDMNVFAAEVQAPGGRAA